MKTLENLNQVKRIIVRDKTQIGWIERKKVGFFKKKDVIRFVSSIAKFFDRDFEIEEELQKLISDDNLILDHGIVYKKCSVKLVYGDNCSRTIYFDSNKAQEDWLKEYCVDNYIFIEK